MQRASSPGCGAVAEEGRRRVRGDARARAHRPLALARRGGRPARSRRRYAVVARWSWGASASVAWLRWRHAQRGATAEAFIVPPVV